MFCSSRANHRSTDFKKLLYLPIPSSDETWKISTDMLCQFFNAQADILSEKNPFLENIFIANTYIKLRVQDFATGKNFSFNQ